MKVDLDYTCEQIDEVLAEPSTFRVKNFLLDLRNGICPPTKQAEEVKEGLVRKEFV